MRCIVPGQHPRPNIGHPPVTRFRFVSANEGAGPGLVSGLPFTRTEGHFAVTFTVVVPLGASMHCGLAL